MKKSGQFLFDSQLTWLQDTKGTLSSKEINETIKVSTPRVFKGVEGDMWSPEHLLISAVSSCFMTTFLFYAKRKGLPLSGFDCEAIGQVELKQDKLKFTEVNIYPKIAIEKEEWTELAKEAIELTKQNCLITKALSVIVYYHPVIEIKQHHPDTSNKKREVFF